MAIFALKTKVSTPKTFESPRIVQNDIRVDFPAGEKHTIVRYRDGVYAIVAPASGEVTIESMTPQFITDGRYGTRKMNGAMVNMAHGLLEQGFDSRTTHKRWPFKEDQRTSFPVDLSVGDVLVCAKSDPGVEIGDRNQGERWGFATSYATFHVVSEAPNPNHFAPPALTFPGKVTDGAGIDVDVEGFVDGLPSYSTANQGIPRFDHIYGRINRHAPIAFFNQVSAAYRTYQIALPYAFNGDPSATNANWGGKSGRTVELACLALISNGFTRDEKIKIATALISHGIQWGDPMVGGGTSYGIDGGHHQVMQGAVAVSRAARNSDMSIFMNKFGGNWRSCFKIEQADMNKIQPHDSVENHPTFSRIREIHSLDGLNINVWMYQPGIWNRYDYYGNHFTGMELHSFDTPGKKALVVAGFSRNGREPDGQTDNYLPGTIDAEPPEGPFTVGERVYFQPSHTINIGDYEWQDKGATQGGNRNQWCPTAGQQYRRAQNWAGTVMLCKAAGWLNSDPDFDYTAGYTYRSMLPDTPTAGNDYPALADDNWIKQFFAQHGADIFA